MVDPRARWENREFRVGPDTVFVNSITGEEATLDEQQKAIRALREAECAREAATALLAHEIDAAFTVEGGELQELVDVGS